MKKNNIASRTEAVSVKRSWLYGGYQREQRVEITFERHGFSYFIDQILNELIPAEVFLGQDLSNLSGGASDELLSIKGRISDQILSKVTIATVFKQFRQSKHAIYSPKVTVTDGFPDQISLKALGRIFPFSPEEFSCALQFYTPTWVTSSLGMAPRINSTVNINAHSDDALVILKCLSTENRDDFEGTELAGVEKLFR